MAIIEEMQALEKNENWYIVEKPKGKTLLGCKWIFTIKYKAVRSIDYQEMFNHVAKLNTIQEW